ncbi:MAG: ATP-binding protein [Halovenus sp.]
MSPTLDDGLFLVTILSGAVLCWLGYYCYRRWNEPGVSPFAAFAVTLGLTALAGGAVGLPGDNPVPESGTPLWADIGILLWSVAMIPWVLFALQYTGRHVRIRARTVVVMVAPILGMAPLVIESRTGQVEVTILVQVIGTIAILYFFCLMIVGIYLLLRTTYKYGHLSFGQGVSLAVAGSTTLVLVNTTGVLFGEVDASIIIAVYAVGYAVPALAVLLAVFSYDMFDSTPAVGAVGERAIARETDDLLFVVDSDGQVIKINETAVEKLGTARQATHGNPLVDVLGSSVDGLQTTDTLELQTDRGQRKFDPQVSELTDQHGRRLGYIVSLRDVTDRELRQQRITVLNRVLRHNLRNQLEVIKANAEVLSDGANGDHAPRILDSADELADIGRRARSVDRALSRPVRNEELDLVQAIDRVLDRLDSEADGVSITLDMPETAPLVSDQDLVESVLESALDNAVRYAAGSVRLTVSENRDGYSLEITDDGPGIPEIEHAPVDAGVETAMQHGTGLGLWQLKWGVTKLNGEVAFNTGNGTSIRITIPDQESSDQLA